MFVRNSVRLHLLVPNLPDPIERISGSRLLIMKNYFRQQGNAPIFKAARLPEYAIGVDIKTVNILFFCLLCWISIILASVRFGLNTFDTENYILHFNNFTIFSLETNFFEPGFSALISMVKFAGGDEKIFLFLAACLGVSLKFVAIHRYSSLLYLSLITYYSKYFLVHEMVQIRVGIASGIFLLSLKYIKNRNIVKFLLLLSVSMLFHYSAVVCILAYIICSNKISTEKVMILATSALVLLIVFSMDTLVLQQLGIFSDKAQGFISATLRGEFDDFKLFNLTNIIRFFVLALLYIRRDIIRKKAIYFDELIRIYALSLLVFYLFRNVPVFAVRISDIFDVVMIFIFPMLIYSFKMKYIGFSLFTIVVLAYFYNNYYSQSLIFS